MRLTVAIPFRNAADTLRDAIRSVVAQSFEDWELLLVDDGSDDDSLILARGVRDARVAVFADGRRLGLTARLNQIAGLARGEYLARMDADDLMHPDRLRRQVEALDAERSIDVMGTATYAMDAAGVVHGVRGPTAAGTSPAAVVAHGLFIHPTVTGRTAWFRRHPYDWRFVRAEDRELWCRTVAVSRFAPIAEPLHFYREGGTGALTKYIESCRMDRAIYRRYGPASAGWPWTARRLAASHLKEAAYCVAAWAGREADLLSLRNAPLSERQRADAGRALAVIRSTPVAGWDEQGEPHGRIHDADQVGRFG